MSDQSNSSPADNEFDEAVARARLPQWQDADVPNYYADTVNIGMNPYGLSLTVGIRGSSPTEPRPTARFHMSPQMAMVLDRLLRRMLKTYEAQNEVRIAVSPTVLKELRVTDEDMAELEMQQGEQDSDVR